MKHGLQIVGAKHQNDDVDGLVAFEAGGQVIDPSAGEVEGVVVHRGAAILPLFDDTPVRPQFGSEPSRPADMDGMANGVGQSDGCRVKAPGVGVAKAENGLHGHKNTNQFTQHGECPGRSIQFFGVL